MNHGISEWTGIEAMMLTDFFENKEKFAEKRTRLRHLNSFVTTEYRQDLPQERTVLENEIKELEEKITMFINSLNMEHLRSIIYMSLDMNAK